MENLLREYLERSFADRDISRPPGSGPVVTLSREFGCPSKVVAQLLTAELNRRPGLRNGEKWRFINKEVVEATAHQLELNPVDVSHLLNATGKGVVEDVLASFASHYVSDHRIRKTVTGVVKSIADQGHVVIVGRGGAAILRHRPATLHVRLQAPMEWRIRSVCESKKITAAEATRMVEEIDRNRMNLLELVTGEKFSPFLFDVSYHCHALSGDEIVASIVALMQSKQMI